MIGSVLVTASKSWSTGVGSVKFDLLNMRRNYIFKYCSLSVITTSNVVAVMENHPMQGHLSLTSKITEMRITWVSNTKSNPMVEYTQDHHTWYVTSSYTFSE